MERKLKHFWVFTFSMALATGQAQARHDNMWDGLVKKLFSHSKVIRITAGLETKPDWKLSPKIVGFRGIVEVPSHIYIRSGRGAVSSNAGQLIFDGSVVCNYSPKSNHYLHSKVFHLRGCSDGSRARDEIHVNKKIELKLNIAATEKASLLANVRVIRSDAVEYGLVFPYINPNEGDILMYNGEAWVATDPASVEALKGEQGEPGPQGEMGPMGPQGPAGADGAVGATGPQGPKGDKGDQGEPGVAGAAGPMGPAGADGAQGPMGPEGPKGADGAVGATGPQGPKGDTGPMGPAGPQGPAGADGAVGATGPQGPQGEAGPQGPAGPKGDKGDQGERGLSEIAYLRDEKPSGVQGGSCYSGSWFARDLNTLGGDNSFITLGSNSFVLQPGKYFIEADVPGYAIGLHKAKLVALETNEDALIGSSSVSAPSSAPATTISKIQGEIIVSATTTFQIHHRCSSTKTTIGLGGGGNFGVPEIYTQVKIIKKQ